MKSATGIPLHEWKSDAGSFLSTPSRGFSSSSDFDFSNPASDVRHRVSLPTVGSGIFTTVRKKSFQEPDNIVSKGESSQRKEGIDKPEDETDFDKDSAQIDADNNTTGNTNLLHRPFLVPQHDTSLRSYTLSKLRRQSTVISKNNNSANAVFRLLDTAHPNSESSHLSASEPDLALCRQFAPISFPPFVSKASQAYSSCDLETCLEMSDLKDTGFSEEINTLSQTNVMSHIFPCSESPENQVAEVDIPTDLFSKFENKIDGTTFKRDNIEETLGNNKERMNSSKHSYSYKEKNMHETKAMAFSHDTNGVDFNIPGVLKPDAYSVNFDSTIENLESLPVSNNSKFLAEERKRRGSHIFFDMPDEIGTGCAHFNIDPSSFTAGNILTSVSTANDNLKLSARRGSTKKESAVELIENSNGTITTNRMPNTSYTNNNTSANNNSLRENDTINSDNDNNDLREEGNSTLEERAIRGVTPGENTHTAASKSSSLASTKENACVCKEEHRYASAYHSRISKSKEKIICPTSMKEKDHYKNSPGHKTMDMRNEDRNLHSLFSVFTDKSNVETLDSEFKNWSTDQDAFNNERTKVPEERQSPDISLSKARCKYPNVKEDLEQDFYQNFLKRNERKYVPTEFLDIFVTKTKPKTLLCQCLRAKNSEHGHTCQTCVAKYEPKSLLSQQKRVQSSQVEYRQDREFLDTTLLEDLNNLSQSDSECSCYSESSTNLQIGYGKETTFPVSPNTSPLITRRYYTTLLCLKKNPEILFLPTAFASKVESDGKRAPFWTKIRTNVKNMFGWWRRVCARKHKARENPDNLDLPSLQNDFKLQGWRHGNRYYSLQNITFLKSDKRNFEGATHDRYIRIGNDVLPLVNSVATESKCIPKGCLSSSQFGKLNTRQMSFFPERSNFSSNIDALVQSSNTMINNNRKVTHSLTPGVPVDRALHKSPVTTSSDLIHADSRHIYNCNESKPVNSQNTRSPTRKHDSTSERTKDSTDTCSMSDIQFLKHKFLSSKEDKCFTLGKRFIDFSNDSNVHGEESDSLLSHGERMKCSLPKQTPCCANENAKNEPFLMNNITSVLNITDGTKIANDVTRNEHRRIERTPSFSEKKFKAETLPSSQDESFLPEANAVSNEVLRTNIKVSNTETFSRKINIPEDTSDSSLFLARECPRDECLHLHAQKDALFGQYLTVGDVYQDQRAAINKPHAFSPTFYPETKNFPTETLTNANLSLNTFTNRDLYDNVQTTNENLKELRARFAMASKNRQMLMAEIDTIALWESWPCPPYSQQRFCASDTGCESLGSISFSFQQERARSPRAPEEVHHGQIVGTLTIEHVKPPVEGFVILK
ncbi:hypothetical protein PoB_002013800 [Plakobranchus ocellatus]|uniref:Uncharacterized protein n=1 Tax=Plakobranchus ocellatus TaxID=259542 RepID=A0AAV3ZFT6_9GAST|nr:hypothetical protein PoB_002013800 [Plakobranchus ocellatus]